MLKVIAEDFIKPEYIETVLPWYRELISATKKEPQCIAYDLYIDEKIRGILFLSKNGQTTRLSMNIVLVSISGDLCR